MKYTRHSHSANSKSVRPTRRSLAMGWIPFGCLVPAWFFVGCSGGSAGTGGGDQNSVNEGTYSVADFQYTDHRPAGANPLGQEGFRALSRDECFTLIPASVGPTHTYELREGPDANYDLVPEASGLFGNWGYPTSAVRAQLDGDAEEELVVALRANNSWVNLVRVDRQSDGSYVSELLHEVGSNHTQMIDVRVSVADVDNDFRDELFLVARNALFGESGDRGEVWGFEDPLDGGDRILTYTRSGQHINLWAHGADVDGDGAHEVVVALTGDSTDSGRFPVRLYELPEGELGMTQLHGWQYLYAATDFDYGRLAIGDFDADGRDDLGWVGYRLANGQSTVRVRLFEYQANHTWNSYATFAAIHLFPTGGMTADRFGVTAFYPRVGQADLAVAYPTSNSTRYHSFHFDRGLNQWDVQSANLERHLTHQTVTLEAADVDADGAQEVAIGLLKFGTDDTKSVDLGTMELDNGLTQVWQDRQVLPSGAMGSGPRQGLVLAPGDYDADGFVLEHTGRNDVKVGSPIPLVLLAAPPTKSGISQNYDDTESLYSFAQVAGSSIGTVTHSAMTYSVEAGFDLFGVLGVSGRYSVDKASERTQTTSKHETTVTGYRGAYDADVIIFQGTLYETYEYRIVAAADPAAVGQLVTLDFPVDANTYKWTVDYYNSQVAPEDRIGPDVVTHTAGDIGTYPTRFELDQFMEGEVHWDFQGSRPVSQSGGSDFQSISFAQEQATEVQRTVTKSYGGGASIGIGGTVDKTNANGSTHSTMFGTEATFEASVGDIAEPSDYERWRYNWGFAVHTVGRLADGQNAPAGYTPRKHHFQYLRYWVDRNGSGY